MADLEPVASVLARGPMPLSQSAKIVTQVCGLLAPLHDTRRAHGAVTPDNIYFSHVGGELTVELRKGISLAATYATPERIQRAPEGPSSDVYSLGVLFFHMITGVPPFDGETVGEIFEQHLKHRPPALAETELQHVPEELELLVHSMLAKDPGQRPPVRKVAHDIDNLELDSTVMGVRIQKALAAEPNETPDLDTSLLHNVSVEVEGRTDPQMIDPYADTLIKNRADLGLDEEDGSQDTHLNLDLAPHSKPSSGWNEDPTRIIDHPPELEPAPSEEARVPAASSKLLFAFGLIFFVVAIATAAFVLLR